MKKDLKPMDLWWTPESFKKVKNEKAGDKVGLKDLPPKDR